MQKTEITLSFDGEKLDALEFYLKKENTTVQKRMNEALTELYERIVPEAVREFLDRKGAATGQTQTSRPPRRGKAPGEGAQTGRANCFGKGWCCGMKSREICVWLDERWYDALSRHLKDETVEDKLGDYLDQLINELVPEQEYSRISQELWQEDRQARQELEAARKFAIFRIRSPGRTAASR